MPLRPTHSTAAGQTSSARKLPLGHFTVICLAVVAALHAEPFKAAAAELHLHLGVVISVALAVAALFYWAIISVQFLVTHPEGEPNLLLGRARTAAPAPTSSASRHTLLYFIVLCFGTGALLHVEPLVDAAAELHVHQGIVACFAVSVTALFNWAIFSLNYRLARRPAEREHKMMARPAAPAASPARSPHLARHAFLVLTALVSASWFVEQFVAAAVLQLHTAVTAVVVLLFAALFNLSVHLFRSFFLPLPPPAVAVAAQAQGHGVGLINVGIVMGIGIAIAVCLVVAGGSACYAFAPARG